MKILLTGTVQRHLDKQHTATLVVSRRARDGHVAETLELRFSGDEAYRAFKERHAVGEGVQVTGLLRQAHAPLRDRATRKPLVGANGRELRLTSLAVEVREHRPFSRIEEGDTLYAHGLVGVVDRRDGLKHSSAGLPYLRMRVAYNHFKRRDEVEGQADFYDLVAFGQLAESLANLDKGDRFLIDQAIPGTSSYEMRDLTHSDGTPVARQTVELALREFTYLPRPRAQSLAPAIEEPMPF